MPSAAPRPLGSSDAEPIIPTAIVADHHRRGPPTPAATRSVMARRHADRHVKPAIAAPSLRPQDDTLLTA